MNLNPQDARLTAHVLGELPPPQAQAVEAAIWNSPALREETEIIQAQSEALVFKFAAEELPSLLPEQRKAILRGPVARTSAPTLRLAPGIPSRRQPLVRPVLKWGGVAAAVAASAIYLADHYQVSVSSKGERVGLTLAKTQEPSLQPGELIAVLENESRRPALPRPAAQAWPVSSDPKPSVSTPASQSDVAATTTASSTPLKPKSAPKLPDYLARPGEAYGPVASVPTNGKSQPTLVSSSVTVPVMDYSALTASIKRLSVSAPNPLLDAEIVPAASVPLQSGNGFVSVLRQCVRDFGLLPPSGVVRIEELVNQFDYSVPKGSDEIGVAVEAATCPWDQARQLVKVTVQGREPNPASLPPVRLTLLVRYENNEANARAQILLWQGVNALLQRLRPEDAVAVVAWGEANGVVLPPCPGNRPEMIKNAIENLPQGGPRTGEMGFGQAASVARLQASVGPGTNRLLIVTDGPSDPAWKDAAANLAKEGIAVSAVQLGPLRPEASPAGVGFASAYQADSASETARLFAREFTLPAETVAANVGVDVQFNPRFVESWRLLGWETKNGVPSTTALTTGGRLRPGQQSTALYEIVPVSTQVMAANLPHETANGQKHQRLLSVDARFVGKAGPATVQNRTLLSAPVKEWSEASPDFQLAAGAAGLGLFLKAEKSMPHRLSPQLIRQLLTPSLADDPHGIRKDFATLVDDVESAQAAILEK